jgi:hypothetical protein
MGDGLKRAVLAALKTRGPWTGGNSHPCDSPWTLTGDEVAAYYEALKAGHEYPSRALGAARGSRKCDRANQLLKKAGLIAYNRKQVGWVAT